MVYESITIADNTIGLAAIGISLALVLALFGIAFFVTVLANHKHRANSKTWYEDQVYAFKAGYIKKKADEQNIELVYPPKADLGQALEEEVSKDLNTV